MKTEGTNLLLITVSTFWSSSRWPLATWMSSRRQRSIPIGGHYRQVSLYWLVACSAPSHCLDQCCTLDVPQAGMTSLCDNHQVNEILIEILNFSVAENVFQNVVCETDSSHLSRSQCVRQKCRQYDWCSRLTMKSLQVNATKLGTK